jgi:hypothetical protein
MDENKEDIVGAARQRPQNVLKLVAGGRWA